MSSSNLGLARFAFNIYGSLASTPHEQTKSRVNEPSRPSSKKKLVYPCEKEITCLSHLRHPLGRVSSSYYDTSSQVPSHHVIIGGKHYLKLLVLNSDQSAIKTDINLVDPSPGFLGRLHASLRLFNVNTVKCFGDMVACGLSSGLVNVFQISSSGKSRLAYKFDDHKRVINSLDFVAQDQLLLSGSQDGTVKLWDLRSYNQKPVLKLQASHHADPVRSCQYSPHSKHKGKMTVLTVHDSGTLSKFDLRYLGNSLNQSLPEKKFTFHTGPALSLHIHPETEHVITGGRDRKLCVWDYSDTSSSSNSPKYVLNAYGPVMKVRWSETPCDLAETHHLHHNQTSSFLSQSMGDFHLPLADFPDLPDPSHLSLFKYDFACLYLNDDPTVTVYNLRRKYIPSEVITTTTGKPIQNFIWANNPLGERRIWSITKSNVFVAYNLSASDEEFDDNVCRPLQLLPKAAADWNHGYGDLALISQEQEEFDIGPNDPNISHDLSEFDDPNNSGPAPEDLSSSYGRDSHFAYENSYPLSASNSKLGSHHNNSSEILHSSPHHHIPMPTHHSMKDRPQLVRLSTHNPMIPPLMSPSPVAQPRASLLEMSGSLTPSFNRPPIGRHSSSHSTQDSASLSSVFIHPSNSAVSMSQNTKKSSLSHTTPYLVSLSLPIPLNDETVFEVLAREYHVCVPDGFTLAQACHMNASIAASVKQFRNFQVWKILAIALDEEGVETFGEATVTSPNHQDDQELGNNEIPGLFVEEDLKSILSELGNFVGSYNSNSTLTTNYGAGDNKHMSRLASSPSAPQDIQGQKPMAIQEDSKSKSPRGGVDINRNRNKQFLKMTAANTGAIEIDSENTRFPPPAEHGFDEQRNMDSASPKDNSPGRLSVKSWGFEEQSQDADNENLHFMLNAANSLSSSSVFGNSSRARHSFLSMRASPHQITSSSCGSSVKRFNGPGARGVSSQARGLNFNLLEKVEENSVKSLQRKNESELTKAMTSNKQENMSLEDKPWSFFNLLGKSLSFAMEQGDIAMSSAMISLFYGEIKQFKTKILRKESSLECLATYIEILRRKELFSDAARIVKQAPRELNESLSELYSGNIDMRFYCCWCEKLLINERSKSRMLSNGGGNGDGAGGFGYWYCDECCRKQLNCIYCNEPCQGLTVVVSLKCGHRGHFGCLQEWFVYDKNSECPGGCEVSVR